MRDGRHISAVERRTHRSDRDSVDHGRAGHDDYADAACGALRALSKYNGFDLFSGAW